VLVSSLVMLSRKLSGFVLIRCSSTAGYEIIEITITVMRIRAILIPLTLKCLDERRFNIMPQIQEKAITGVVGEII